MGALLKLTKDIRQMSDLPAALNPDPWACASDEARRVAGLRESLLQPLADLVNGGASINHAAALLKSQLAAGTADLRTKHLVAMLAGDAVVDVISEPTIKRWLSGYIKDGKVIEGRVLEMVKARLESVLPGMVPDVKSITNPKAPSQ